MPLVVLGSGIMNKSQVKFHDKMVVVVGRIVECLALNQSKRELFILLIDEFMTSAISLSQILLHTHIA